MGLFEKYELKRNMDKKQLMEQLLDKKKRFTQRMNNSKIEAQIEAENSVKELNQLLEVANNIDDSFPDAALVIEAYSAADERGKLDDNFLSGLKMAVSNPADYQNNENYKQAAAVAFHMQKLQRQDLCDRWLGYAKSSGADDVLDLISRKFSPAQSGTAPQQTAKAPQQVQQTAQRVQPQAQSVPRPENSRQTQQSAPVPPPPVPQQTTQIPQNQYQQQQTPQMPSNPYQQRQTQQWQNRTQNATAKTEKPKKKSSLLKKVIIFIVVINILRACGSAIFGEFRDTANAKKAITMKGVNDKDATPAEFFEYYINDERGVIIEKYTGNDTSVVIPSAIDEIRVYAIKSGAFTDNTALSEIRIKSGTAVIDEDAFHGCKSLQRIVLPDTLELIGSEAFCDCISLTEITIPEGTKEIRSNAFLDCKSLLTVSIPGSATLIGNHAFKNCGALEQLVFAEGKEAAVIESWAFEACKSLTGIALPSQYTAIGEGAFYQCESLQQVVFSKNMTTVGERAFEECYSLQSVSLPAATERIGSSAFRYCTALQTFTWENSGMNYANQVIEGNAFLACESLAEVYLSGSVSAIGHQAFSKCTSLTTFVWEASGAVYEDQSIGSEALAYNERLSYVFLSANVGEIGDGLLRDCNQAVVHTASGSAAETYSREREIPVVIE